MYFDTHAHYDSEAFNEDRDLILSRLEGISLVLNPGCDRETSQQAVSYADKYPHVYAAVGWHPHEARHMDEGGEDFIKQAAKNPKVRAIGEIGLDYHYDHSPREIQRECFVRQMELARQLSLPVIIHDREAHSDTLEVIKGYPDVLGVFHCYSGSAEMAREIIKLGWYLSFTGAITFKNARRAIEAIEFAPADRLMLETDSPYLTPVPFRGKRNDSRNIPYIAQVMAEAKGMDTRELEELTMENSLRFFGIKNSLQSPLFAGSCERI